MKDFLFWMLDKGQTMVEALSYAPLPKHVVEMEKARHHQAHPLAEWAR